MSWVRLDDRFTSHPKIAALTDREFRAWLRILCWCGAYAKDGAFKRKPVTKNLAGVTPRMIDRFLELGLLDSVDVEHVSVHDWRQYNGPKDPNAAERVRRHRELNPRVSTNQWSRAREQVYERDDGRCFDCGQTSEDWHADHDPDRRTLEMLGESIYDLQFIFTRCPSCHAKKTRREAAARKSEPTPNHTEPQTEPGSASLARGADPNPRPEDQRQEDLGLSAVRSEITLPVKNELGIAKLLGFVGDARDEETEGVIRGLSRRLPEGSLAKVLESAQMKNGQIENRAAYVVGALKSEIAEREGVRA